MIRIENRIIQNLKTNNSKFKIQNCACAKRNNSKLKTQNSLTSLEEILQSVHVEAKREAQRLVERVALRCSDDVAGIEREHAHLKAGTHGEIFAVTLVCRLMMVASA